MFPFAEITLDVLNRCYSHHNNHSYFLGKISRRTHRIERNECFGLGKNYFNGSNAVKVQEILMTLGSGQV